MKKLLILKSLLLSLMLVSCNVEDVPYSYLSQPGVEAEIVKVDFEVGQDGGAFSYLVQASEMYVDWGDGSKPTEYVLADKMDIDSVKSPIRHVYEKRGNYQVVIYALKLQGLDFSKTEAAKNKGADLNNRINSVELTNCKKLRRLVLSDQPVVSLDVSNCPDLQTLDCRGASKLTDLLLADQHDNLNSLLIEGTNIASVDCGRLKSLQLLDCGTSDGAGLDIISVENLKFMRDFRVNGYLKNTRLELSGIDSLRSVSLNNSNIVDFSVLNSGFLSHVLVNNSVLLNSIQFQNCKSLQNIVLKNNAALEAIPMNAMFAVLPQVSGAGYTIGLSNNAGDAVCDRSIATSKGWQVVDLH